GACQGTPGGRRACPAPSPPVPLPRPAGPPDQVPARPAAGRAGGAARSHRLASRQPGRTPPMMRPLLDAHASTAPARPKTEKISAVAVALIMAGALAAIFLTWPIPAAIPPTVAAVVAYAPWISTTYAHPVQSPNLLPT